MWCVKLKQFYLKISLEGLLPYHLINMLTKLCMMHNVKHIIMIRWLGLVRLSWKFVYHILFPEFLFDSKLQNCNCVVNFINSQHFYQKAAKKNIFFLYFLLLMMPGLGITCQQEHGDFSYIFSIPFVDIVVYFISLLSVGITIICKSIPYN